ncbi:hypothetical protein CUMW_007710 [Citrus unshiu]|nr:hypothetical protein CUMW_007710 [Citrus unshiu]
MEYFVDMAIISSFSSFLFLGLAFYSSFSDLVNVTAEEETEVEEKLRMAKRKGHREDRRTGREPMIAISPSMLARQLNMYPSSRTRFSCCINYILKSVNLAVNMNRKAQILEGLSRSCRDACYRLSLGFCGAICACYHECDVVWEDPERIEENFSEEAVIDRKGKRGSHLKITMNTELCSLDI